MFNLFNKNDMLRAKVNRGKGAEKILSEPIVIETFAAMERDIVSIMKRLKPNDADGRDVAWRELRALERFKTKFENYVHIGREAEKSLLKQ